MAQLDDQRSVITTSTFFSCYDDDDQDDEDREPLEMKYCPEVVVKCEPQDKEGDEDNDETFRDAVSSLNSICGSECGGDEEEAEDEQYNSRGSGGGRPKRASSRKYNLKGDDSESDWEEEWVKEKTSPKKKRRKGSRRSPSKKKTCQSQVKVEEEGDGEDMEEERSKKKKSYVYKPISELTSEQQEKRRAQWRMKDIKRSESKVRRKKKRISELTPEQQERRRQLWREQKMRKMERREVMLREVIKDELEDDWEGEEEGGGEGECEEGTNRGGRRGDGGGRRKKISEMTEEEREKWRARWRLDSARRVAKRKGLPVPEKLEDVQKNEVKSRDSECSFDSDDSEAGKSGRSSGGGDGGGGKRRKRISEMTEEEKEKKRAKWRLERARKIARAKGLPVPEKLEDIPVKRECSAENSPRKTSGGGGGGGSRSRKKRVAEMTEEEKEQIRAKWRLERQRKRERALGLPQSTTIDQCTSKPRNPRNVRTLKDAITEEEREKVRAQYRRDMERRRQRYKTLTPEQRQEMYQKMKIYKISKIARMSEDELKMYKMDQYFKYQAKKANLTEEQKERRRQSVQRRSKRKWQEIKQDPEKLQRLKEARKEYRQNLSPEKRERFLEKLRESARQCLIRKRRAMGDFREVVPRGPRRKGRREGVGEGVGEEWKWRKRLTQEEKEKKNEWRRILDKKRRLEQRLTMQNLMDGGMTMEQIMQQTETGQQRKRRLFKMRINKAKRELRKKLLNHNLPPEEINQRLSELEASYQPSREFRVYKPRKDGDSERVDPKELEYLEEILKTHPGAKIQARTPAGSKKSKKSTSSQPANPSTATAPTTSTPSLFTTPIPSTSKRRGRPSSKIEPKIENPPPPSSIPSSTSTSHHLLQQPPPHPNPQTYYSTPTPESSHFPQSSYPSTGAPQTHYPYATQHQSFIQSHSQPQPSTSYSLQNTLQNITVPSTTSASTTQHYQVPSSTTSSQCEYGNYEDPATQDFDDGDPDNDSISYHDDDDPNDNNYSPPSSPSPPPPSTVHHFKKVNHREADQAIMQNYHQNYFQPFHPPPQPSRIIEPSRQMSYPSRPSRLPTTSLDPTKKPRVRKYYPPKLRPGAKPRTKRADVIRDAVCDECGKAFNSMYIREHQRIYHNPNYDPMKMECLICHERFKLSKKWYQHYLHVHLGHVKMRRGMKVADVNIICEECGDPFKDNFKLKRHMFYKHGEGQRPENQFNCPVESCKFHTKDGATVQRHLRRVHADLGEIFFCTGKIKCWRCPRNDFKNEGDLRVHVKECHPGSSFPCEWCGAVKFTQLALNLHYSTNKCAKRPKGAEKRGMKQVEGLPFLSIERAMVPCPICGKMLRIMSLVGHLKGTHNVEERREWRCEGDGGRCGKIYKRREFYAGHLEEAHEWKWEDMRGMMGEINGGNLEGMVRRKVHKNWTRIRKRMEEGEGDSEEMRKNEEKRGRRNVTVICEEDDGGDDNKAQSE